METWVLLPCVLIVWRCERCREQFVVTVTVIAAIVWSSTFRFERVVGTNLLRGPIESALSGEWEWETCCV